MSAREVMSRVYRETVEAYAEQGIARREAIHAATATLMNEIRAGRLVLDMEDAVHASLVRIDKDHGRMADNILRRAAQGQSPLADADMDVVVTLGKGYRKLWRFVTADDLDAMVAIRFENFRKARDSYRAFVDDARLVRSTVELHGTFGAAFDAGGFPPADLLADMTAA